MGRREEKRAILFLSLSLRLVLRPHSSRLRRSPLIRVLELPWLKKTLVRNCDVYGLATPLIYLLTVIVVPHIL